MGWVKCVHCVKAVNIVNAAAAATSGVSCRKSPCYKFACDYCQARLFLPGAFPRRSLGGRREKPVLRSSLRTRWDAL